MRHCNHGKCQKPCSYALAKNFQQLNPTQGLKSLYYILPVPASEKPTPTSWQLGVEPSGSRTITGLKKNYAVCVKREGHSKMLPFLPSPIARKDLGFPVPEDSGSKVSTILKKFVSKVSLEADILNLSWQPYCVYVMLIPSNSKLTGRRKNLQLTSTCTSIFIKLMK